MTTPGDTRRCHSQLKDVRFAEPRTAGTSSVPHARRPAIADFPPSQAGSPSNRDNASRTRKATFPVPLCTSPSQPSRVCNAVSLPPPRAETHPPSPPIRRHGRAHALPLGPSRLLRHGYKPLHPCGPCTFPSSSSQRVGEANSVLSWDVGGPPTFPYDDWAPSPTPLVPGKETVLRVSRSQVQIQEQLHNSWALPSLWPTLNLKLVNNSLTISQDFPTRIPRCPRTLRSRFW